MRAVFFQRLTILAPLLASLAPPALSTVLLRGSPFAVRCRNLLEGGFDFAPEFRKKLDDGTDSVLLFFGESARPEADRERWRVLTIPGFGEEKTYEYRVDAVDYVDAGTYFCFNKVQETAPLTVVDLKPSCHNGAASTDAVQRAGAAFSETCRLERSGPDPLELVWMSGGKEVARSGPEQPDDAVLAHLEMTLGPQHHGAEFECVLHLLDGESLQCGFGPLDVHFQPMLQGDPKVFATGDYFHAEFTVIGNPPPDKDAVSISPAPSHQEISVGADGRLHIKFETPMKQIPTEMDAFNVTYLADDVSNENRESLHLRSIPVSIKSDYNSASTNAIRLPFPPILFVSLLIFLFLNLSTSLAAEICCLLS